MRENAESSLSRVRADAGARGGAVRSQQTEARKAEYYRLRDTGMSIVGAAAAAGIAVATARWKYERARRTAGDGQAGEGAPE